MITLATISAVCAIISTIVSVAVTVVPLVATVGTVDALVELLNSNSAAVKGFDFAYTDLVSQAMVLFIRFMGYAQMLIVLCAFLCLIFNAFKLWAGPAEIKKIFIDNIYKTVIVVALVFIYPSLITKTYSLATEIGVDASGGHAYLMSNFANLAEKVTSIWKTYGSEAFQILKNEGVKSVDENFFLAFRKTGLTDAEIKQWFESRGFTYGANVSNDIQAKALTEASKKIKAYEATPSASETRRRMKQSLMIIDSLREILTDSEDGEVGVDKADRIKIMNMGEETLQTVFFNPYMTGTERLSISTMVKTALVIGEIASNGSLAGLEPDDEDEGMSWKDATESKSPNVFIKFIWWLFKAFLYKAILAVAVLFIMIEYALTLIEFYIVMGISTLLIPLFFIDATKQFATNILKTVFSYFIKILVSAMMCFFVMSLFIKMGTEMCGMEDLASYTVFLYFLFNIIIGCTLAKQAPKIASAVISGNPSLGIGDFVNEVRGAMHAGRSGIGVIKNFLGNTQRVANAGGSIAGKGSANLGAAGSAAWKSTLDTNDALKRESLSRNGDEKISRTERLGAATYAGIKSLGSSLNSMVGDWAFKKTHGGAERYRDKKSVNQVGQLFKDEHGNYRQANLKDIQDAARERSKDETYDAIKKYIKEKDDDKIERPASEEGPGK